MAFEIKSISYHQSNRVTGVAIKRSFDSYSDFILSAFA